MRKNNQTRTFASASAPTAKSSGVTLARTAALKSKSSIPSPAPVAPAPSEKKANKIAQDIYGHKVDLYKGWRACFGGVKSGFYFQGRNHAQFYRSLVASVESVLVETSPCRGNSTFWNPEAIASMTMELPDMKENSEDVTIYTDSKKTVLCSVPFVGRQITKKTLEGYHECFVGDPTLAGVSGGMTGYGCVHSEFSALWDFIGYCTLYKKPLFAHPAISKKLGSIRRDLVRWEQGTHNKGAVIYTETDEQARQVVAAGCIPFTTKGSGSYYFVGLKGFYPIKDYSSNQYNFVGLPGRVNSLFLYVVAFLGRIPSLPGYYAGEIGSKDAALIPRLSTEKVYVPGNALLPGRQMKAKEYTCTHPGPLEDQRASLSPNPWPTGPVEYEGVEVYETESVPTKDGYVCKITCLICRHVCCATEEFFMRKALIDKVKVTELSLPSAEDVFRQITSGQTVLPDAQTVMNAIASSASSSSSSSSSSSQAASPATPALPAHEVPPPPFGDNQRYADLYAAWTGSPDAHVKSTAFDMMKDFVAMNDPAANPYLEFYAEESYWYPKIIFPTPADLDSSSPVDVAPLTSIKELPNDFITRIKSPNNDQSTAPVVTPMIVDLLPPCKKFGSVCFGLNFVDKASLEHVVTFPPGFYKVVVPYDDNSSLRCFIYYDNKGGTSSLVCKRGFAFTSSGAWIIHDLVNSYFFAGKRVPPPPPVVEVLQDADEEYVSDESPGQEEPGDGGGGEEGDVAGDAEKAVQPVPDNDEEFDA